MHIHRPISSVATQNQAQPVGTPLGPSAAGDGNFAALMAAENRSLPERSALEIMKGQVIGSGNPIAKTDSAEARDLSANLVSSEPPVEAGKSDSEPFGDDQQGADGQALGILQATVIESGGLSPTSEPQARILTAVPSASAVRTERLGPHSPTEVDQTSGLMGRMTGGEPEALVEPSLGSNTIPPQQSQSAMEAGSYTFGAAEQKPDSDPDTLGQSGIDSPVLNAVAQSFVRSSADLSSASNHGGLAAATGPEGAGLETEMPDGRETVQRLPGQVSSNDGSKTNSAGKTVSDRGLTPGLVIERQPTAHVPGLTSQQGAEVAAKAHGGSGSSDERPLTAAAFRGGVNNRSRFDHQPNQDRDGSAATSPLQEPPLSMATTPVGNSKVVAGAPSQSPSSGTQADLAPEQFRPNPEGVVGMVKTPSMTDNQRSGVLPDQVLGDTLSPIARPVVFQVSNRSMPLRTALIETIEASSASGQQTIQRSPLSGPQERQGLPAHAPGDDDLRRPMMQRVDPAGAVSVSTSTAGNVPITSPLAIDQETQDLLFRVPADQSLARSMPHSFHPMATVRVRPVTDSADVPFSVADKATELRGERSFVTAFMLHAVDDPTGTRSVAELAGVRGIDDGQNSSTANPSKSIAAQDTTPVAAKPAIPMPPDGADHQRPSALPDKREEGVLQPQTAAPILDLPAAATKMAVGGSLTRQSEQLGLLADRPQVKHGSPARAGRNASSTGADEDQQLSQTANSKGQTKPKPSSDLGSAVPLMAPITDPSMPLISPDSERGDLENAFMTGSGIGFLQPILHHSMTSQIAPRHLFVQVSQGLQTLIRQETADQIKLTLSPEELGHVQFEMTTKGDRLHISLYVERGETMELLRRNVDQLLGELRQSGLGQPSLSFGNWSQREQAKGERAASPDGIDPSESAITPSLPHSRLIAADGRLDLRL